MKKIIALCAVATTLFGCQAMQNNQKDEMVGMANPASVFCIEQGGKSEIRKNADGSEYGVCILPNGQTVDEWDYFRQHNAQ